MRISFLQLISIAAVSLIFLSYYFSIEVPIDASEEDPEISKRPTFPPNCPGSVTVFVMLMSDRKDKVKRQVVRNTWLSTTLDPCELQISWKFFLGHDASTETKDIEDEEDQFTDIVQLDVSDHPRFVTDKLSEALAWTAVNAPKADFVLKAELDAYVNVKLIASQLRSIVQMAREPSQRVYIGSYIEGMKPLRQPSGHPLFVSTQDYPPIFFAPYMHGGAYLMNWSLMGEVALSVQDECSHVRGIEDATVGLHVATRQQRSCSKAETTPGLEFSFVQLTGFITSYLCNSSAISAIDFTTIHFVHKVFDLESLQNLHKLALDERRIQPCNTITQGKTSSIVSQIIVAPVTQHRKEECIAMVCAASLSKFEETEQTYLFDEEDWKNRCRTCDENFKICENKWHVERSMCT